MAVYQSWLWYNTPQSQKDQKLLARYRLSGSAPWKDNAIVNQSRIKSSIVLLLVGVVLLVLGSCWLIFAGIALTGSGNPEWEFGFAHTFFFGMLAVFFGAPGIMLLYVTLIRLYRGQRTTPPPLEQRVLDAARERNNLITAAEVAELTGLSLEEARHYLETQAQQGRARLQQGTEGAAVYSFEGI